MAVILKLPCDDTTHRVEVDTDGNFKLLDHPDQMAKAFSAFGAKTPQCLRIVQRALSVPPDAAMLLHFAFPVASVNWDPHTISSLEDVFDVEHQEPQNEYDAHILIARLALDLANHGLENIRSEHKRDAIWEMLERSRDWLDKAPYEEGDPSARHQREQDRVAMDEFAMKGAKSEWQTARGIYWALVAADEVNPEHWFEAYEDILAGFIYDANRRKHLPDDEAEDYATEHLHAWTVARVVEALEHIQKGGTWPT
jgi:hypothetical protein